jgi:cytochrome b561
MALRNTERSWGLVARVLHWSIAAIILFQLAVGVYMVNVIGDDIIARYDLTQTHKSWGFVVFALGLARIAWRWANPTPELPEMPAWQRSASQASHVALYALMIAIPVTGWLMASASPFNDPDAYVRIRNTVFGLFELPDPYPQGSEALTEQLARFHAGFALALAGLLAVHVAAALKHQFVDRDGLLRRMIRGE